MTRVTLGRCRTLLDIVLSVTCTLVYQGYLPSVLYVFMAYYIGSIVVAFQWYFFFNETTLSVCQSDCENDLLFLLTLEGLPVMQPTNKLNKSSVKVGAWVRHTVGWLLLILSMANSTWSWCPSVPLVPWFLIQWTSLTFPLPNEMFKVPLLWRHIPPL